MTFRVILPLLVSGLAAVGAPASKAQAQTPVPTGTGVAVEVIVHDSLSGGPLGGATVQLAAADNPLAFSRTGETDSLGRVAFRDVPHGRYRIGFMHPILDAIGVSAPLREARVEGDRPQQVHLAIPSAGRLRTAVCGPDAAADSSGVFIGTVRDPRDGMPLADATVAGEWREVTFGAGGIRQGIRRIAATTGPNGWFALCGLPPGIVAISARQGADSVPALELEVRPQELRREDLYLPYPGRAQLSGRVTTADSSRPLVGARVTLADGLQAQTNERGEWTLPSAPLGTRMLEVRAIGYYPDRRPVHVVAGAPPLEVALTTFQAVLEAVRVTASRMDPATAGGFMERRRSSGMGRFLDGEQVARRNPVVTSDLLRTLPGFVGDGSLAMRGNFSDGGGNFGVDCTAEVYIDGHLMRGLSAAELDALVDPAHIVGIEVYSAGAPRPAQFESGMSGCGALVIWQKPMGERVGRRR